MREARGERTGAHETCSDDRYDCDHEQLEPAQKLR